MLGFDRKSATEINLSFAKEYNLGNFC
uniref:Uncharacterized protein n=1 Tax=Arundo donax TaxID=35708 RepID=A0A0A8YHD9_ARUDO